MSLNNLNKKIKKLKTINKITKKINVKQIKKTDSSPFWLAC
jgi:hypothetical protein